MKFLKIILLAIIICFAGYSAKSQVKYKLTVPSDQQIEKREMKNREIYNHIKSPDLQRITKPGAPNLPVKYINLLVPPGTENYKITVETGKEKTIQLQKHIAPVQPPIPTAINYEQPEFVRPDSAIYSSNQPYPEKRVEVVEVNHMRGNKILTLAVHPYIYYPKDKQLKMYGIQDVLVKYENRPDKKISNYRRGNPAIKDLILLKSMIDNKKDVARFNVWKTIDEQKIAPDNTEQNSKSVDMGYEYVIITSQNLSSAFDEFIEWKKRKGIDIGLVTVEDILDHYTGDMISGIYDNAGKVRQYLKDAYGYGLEYALLGGDHTVVPIRYGTGDDDTWTYIPENPNDYKIPADLYFSDFDGDWNVDGDKYYGEKEDNVDVGPEIFVGRLLCSGATQVERWTEKILNYEQNPGNGDHSYLGRAFYTQADQMQDYDQATRIANEWNSVFPTDESEIFEEEYNDTADFESAGTPEFPKAKDVIDEMNKHYGLVSWFGHGSPDLVNVATPLINKCTDEGKHQLVYKDSHVGGCEAETLRNGLDKLTNIGYPSVVYTVSCTNTPFDDFRHPVGEKNLGEGFTVLTRAGGPIYLGNTRYGFTITSFRLYKSYVNAVTNSGLTQFGKAESISKVNYFNPYLRLSHNLIGCPEANLWTDLPAEFTDVTITENEGDVTVNTGNIEGCKICVMTSDDGGVAYWDTISNVTSHTFLNVPKPYYVTITKKNYLPYMAEVACPEVIAGSGPICSNSTKTFSFDVDIPDGAAYWAHSDNLTIVSGEGTGSCSFQATDNSGEEGWIKAGVYGGCGTFSRSNIWVGKPEAYFDVSFDPVPVQEFSNTTAIASSEGADTYFWDVINGTLQSGQGINTVQISAPSCDKYIWVNVTANNSCGENNAISSLEVSCKYKSGALKIYPIPCDNQVTVTLKNNNKSPDRSENLKMQTSFEEKYSYHLYDLNYQLIKEFETNIQTVQISTYDLNEGFYILHVIKGERLFKAKIEVRH